MKRACIVYRSLTNNTEKIASLLASKLLDYEVELLNMDGLEPAILLQYDGVLIGAFTRGRGTLHYDCNVFYKKLNRVDFSSKVVGCFGSGDRSFTHFCGAVDLFYDKVVERGATVVSQKLKIHLGPDSEDIGHCHLFVQEFRELVENQKVPT